jgi:ABC-type transport system involved in cytochrome bd biosynthesis fused ATPase/permease subunit
VDILEIARWQFGIITVYHFLFVPITIGLSALVAAYETAWVRGLDTRLGEGGAAVSGGERARIGVARSLLADQPVLVLDEPTAHLDHATAELLAEEVLDATLGRTVVWITHEPLGLDRLDGVVDLTALPRPAARPGSRMAE